MDLPPLLIHFYSVILLFWFTKYRSIGIFISYAIHSSSQVTPYKFRMFIVNVSIQNNNKLFEHLLVSSL